MALYHKWDVKNGFTYVLQFFPLIFDGLGGVLGTYTTYSPFSSFSMFAGLLLTRLADLPTAGILEDITLAGWVTGSLVTAKVIY